MADVTDREFLVWLHERLEYIYKERPIEDFMHKLKAIAVATPIDQVSPLLHQLQPPVSIEDSLHLRGWYFKEQEKAKEVASTWDCQPATSNSMKMESASVRYQCGWVDVLPASVINLLMESKSQANVATVSIQEPGAWNGSMDTVQASLVMLMEVQRRRLRKMEKTAVEILDSIINMATQTKEALEAGELSEETYMNTAGPYLRAAHRSMGYAVFNGEERP
jgi:hypothetical protein